jgi:hypothetical protein
MIYSFRKKPPCTLMQGHVGVQIITAFLDKASYLFSYIDLISGKSPFFLFLQNSMVYPPTCKSTSEKRKGAFLGLPNTILTALEQSINRI